MVTFLLSPSGLMLLGLAWLSALVLRPVRVKHGDTISDAERRGAAQVLREIAQLDAGQFLLNELDENLDSQTRCLFCGSTRAHKDGDTLGDLIDKQPHADDCLLARALAVVTPQGER